MLTWPSLNAVSPATRCAYGGTTLSHAASVDKTGGAHWAAELGQGSKTTHGVLSTKLHIQGLRVVLYALSSRSVGRWPTSWVSVLSIAECKSAPVSATASKPLTEICRTCWLLEPTGARHYRAQKLSTMYKNVLAQSVPTDGIDRVG